MPGFPLCPGEEERIGSKLLGEELDMKESGSKLHKTTKERLIAARKRRLEREPRGTDEKYIKCITEEYKIDAGSSPAAYAIKVPPLPLQ